MKAQFRSAVLFVKDMASSRRFYEQILGQEVDMDLGVNVGYQCGLALWDVKAAFDVLFHHAPESDAPSKQTNMEIYFEIDDLDTMLNVFTGEGVSLVHPIIEQPWAQRALRVYDPDGYIVEVAEPMPVVVNRLAASGLDKEAIVARTYMPLPVVEQLLAEFAESKS